MPSHFIDFEIQQDVFSTPELRAVFDEKARLQRWLDIESALALSQAELGLIPKEAAKEISLKAKLDCLDLEALKKEYQVNRNSVLPVLKALRNACQNKHGEFVHYGVTTQDIVDTGQVLEIKQTLSIIYRDLRKIESVLLKIAEKHSKTPMIGRTHGQYAMPITFGLKVAVWVAEIRRHIERIKSISSRVLIGQLSGAVGTKAALGEQARVVAQKTLNRLGLSETPASWHTARDNMAEVCACFTMLVGTIAKIANEIFLLTRTDIMELKEPSAKKAMSSSTMPHKSNPVLCERIVVLFKHVRALLGVSMESMIHENERDPRSLWAEWLTFPQLSIYTGTALNYALLVLEGLVIYSENMKNNLYQFKELVVSEYLLFKLAGFIGKMNAQEKLHRLISLAGEKGIPLKEALSNDEIGRYFTAEDYDVIDHPGRYIGHAENIVVEVLNATKEKHEGESEKIFSDIN